METLDMLGRPCPIPVVSAKRALALPGTGAVALLVDNLAAAQNLEKMAAGLGYVYACRQEAPARWRVTLEKGGAGQSTAAPLSAAGQSAAAHGPAGQTAPALSPAPVPAEAPAVLITAAGLGRGSDELGALLMKGFIFSLTELCPAPRAAVFFNGGARLTAAGSACVPDLLALSAKGCDVLTCGTCINYYGLPAQPAAGRIANMADIAALLAAAPSLISL